MKLITAIINKRDTGEVCDSLTEAKVTFTKMSTMGGFLKAGNATLLIGVEDEKVDFVIDIIRKHCAQRMEPLPAVVNTGVPMYGYYQTEVLVGGATVFVTNVERFEKM
jgi:uncharacterized protein YaaQ